MSDPKVIYLGPACEAETGDGRTWAEDNPWPDCECGHRPVQYVHGETFERMKAEREALQLLLNNRDDLEDQLTSLEQRRYAEQQAREAAERRVGELGARISEASAKLELAASMMDDDVRGNRFAAVCRLAISALNPIPQ